VSSDRERELEELVRARAQKLFDQGLSKEDVAVSLMNEGYPMKYILKYTKASLRKVKEKMDELGIPAVGHRRKSAKTAVMDVIAHKTREHALRRIADILSIGSHVLEKVEDLARFRGMTPLEYVKKAIDFYEAYSELVDLLEAENKRLRRRLNMYQRINLMLMRELKLKQLEKLFSS